MKNKHNHNVNCPDCAFKTAIINLTVAYQDELTPDAIVDELLASAALVLIFCSKNPIVNYREMIHKNLDALIDDNLAKKEEFLKDLE